MFEDYSMLPNNKMIDRSKFKVFADDNLNVKFAKFFLDYECREHRGFPHNVSFFVIIFSKGYFLRVVKDRIV